MSRVFTPFGKSKSTQHAHQAKASRYRSSRTKPRGRYYSDDYADRTDTSFGVGSFGQLKISENAQTDYSATSYEDRSPDLRADDREGNETPPKSSSKKKVKLKKPKSRVKSKGKLRRFKSDETRSPKSSRTHRKNMGSGSSLTDSPRTKQRNPPSTPSTWKTFDDEFGDSENSPKVAQRKAVQTRVEAPFPTAGHGLQQSSRSQPSDFGDQFEEDVLDQKNDEASRRVRAKAGKQKKIHNLENLFSKEIERKKETVDELEEAGVSKPWHIEKQRHNEFRQKMAQQRQTQDQENDGMDGGDLFDDNELTYKPKPRPADPDLVLDRDLLQFDDDQPSSLYNSNDSFSVQSLSESDSEEQQPGTSLTGMSGPSPAPVPVSGSNQSQQITGKDGIMDLFKQPPLKHDPFAALVTKPDPLFPNTFGETPQQPQAHHSHHGNPNTQQPYGGQANPYASPHAPPGDRSRPPMQHGKSDTDYRAAGPQPMQSAGSDPFAVSDFDHRHSDQQDQAQYYQQQQNEYSRYNQYHGSHSDEQRPRFLSF